VPQGRSRANARKAGAPARRLAQRAPEGRGVKTGNEASVQAAALRVSVVIASHERPQLLLRCLRALVRQDLEPAAYVVIVVDAGSSPPARRAARTGMEGLAARPGAPALRYVQQPRNGGPAAARNAGWQAARAPVVAFTDDDTLPCADWLREGLAALARGFDAVAGRIAVPLPATPPDNERDAAGV
jgi:cellulose synthase/poly-beta-1,6-N-acetylglucosamine synthase-like glycosyltransferase